MLEPSPGSARLLTMLLIVAAGAALAPRLRPPEGAGGELWAVERTASSRP